MNITPKAFSTTFLLLFNTFTWFFMTLIIINNIQTSLDLTSEILIPYYTAIVLSSIAGATLSHRIKRLKLLYFWMALGTALSILPALLRDNTFLNALTTSFLLGTSIGLGMPSALAYFADYTMVENRGRISAFIFLATNLGAIPLAIPFISSDLTKSSLFLATWRGAGLTLFFALKPEDQHKHKARQTPLTQALHDTSFVLYFVPWIMFTFIDRFVADLLPFGREFAEIAIGSFSAFVGGFLSDKIGRKRVVVYSFILLGIAYGAAGITPTLLVSQYLYLILDGFAAGMLWTTCILIVWGDLSQSGTREKYYVIGNIPFFLSRLPPILLSPYILQIPMNAAFSLASFFLFLAVVPLMYAPETLPEKKIELRRLKSYVEQAMKLTQKHTKKNDHKS